MYLLYNSVVEAYQTVVLLKGVCKILFTNAMFKSINIFETFFCNICLPGGKCCKIVLNILCHFLLPITLPGVAQQLVSVSRSNQHFFFYTAFLFLYLAANNLQQYTYQDIWVHIRNPFLNANGQGPALSICYRSICYW